MRQLNEPQVNATGGEIVFRAGHSVKTNTQCACVHCAVASARGETFDAIDFLPQYTKTVCASVRVYLVSWATRRTEYYVSFHPTGPDTTDIPSGRDDDIIVPGICLCRYFAQKRVVCSGVFEREGEVTGWVGRYIFVAVANITVVMQRIAYCMYA